MVFGVSGCCLNVQQGLRFGVMTHPHSGADDAVARALAREVQSQMNWDFDLLAESAVDAVLDYEDEINDEYVRQHPESFDQQGDDPRPSLHDLAQRIRNIECPYGGTEGIAFREARDTAARLVEKS